MRVVLMAAAFVAVLGGGGGRAAGASAQEPWDRGPFAASPQEIRDAAAAITAPPGTGAVVLLEEGRIGWDAAGRQTWRYRRVYKILDPGAVSSWGATSAWWSPWYQERPSVRARVVGPDGTVHELDPRTLTEIAPTQRSPDVYSDRRGMTAPLPGIAVHAVVEEEIVIRDHRPFFEGGDVGRFWFGANVPVRRTRLVLEAPATLPLRWVKRLLPDVTPKRAQIGDVVRWTFEAGPLPPLEEPEPNLPPDVPPQPYVAFSTGHSWNDVARRYARLVDERIATTDLRAAVREAIGEERDPARAADKALAWLRGRVRYSGLEFGEQSIVPWTPAETLARKFGDCKDQAILLVGLLRAAGHPADVVLLSTGPGADVEPALPGLGAFNHAIVRLDGPRPIWIDPTHPYTRAGLLPTSDEGRQALLVSPRTRTLAPTPRSDAGANQIVETRTFRLAEMGPSRVEEAMEVAGQYDLQYRDKYASGTEKDHRADLQSYVERTYLAESLDSFRHTPASDLSATFRLELSASRASRGKTFLDEAWVYVFPSEALAFLPSSLTEEEPPARPRRHDFEVLIPHTYEIRNRIVLPPGFSPAPLPPDATTPLGPATLTRRFLRRDDGIEAIFRFELARHRLTPAEIVALRKAAAALREEAGIRLGFEQTGMAHVAAGRIREGLAELQRLAALHPREALHHIQIARAWLAAGLGEVARREARRAVSLEPTSLAYANLAWVLEHDLLGRRFGRGHNRAGALAAYRKAVALGPEDLDARAALAIFSSTTSAGSATPERPTSMPRLPSIEPSGSADTRYSTTTFCSPSTTAAVTPS